MRHAVSTSFADTPSKLDGLLCGRRAYATFRCCEVNRFGRRARGDRRRLWAVRPVEPCGLRGLRVVSERARFAASALARAARGRVRSACRATRAASQHSTWPQGFGRDEPRHQPRCAVAASPSIRARDDGDAPESVGAPARWLSPRWLSLCWLGSARSCPAQGRHPWHAGGRRGAAARTEAPNTRPRTSSARRCQASTTARF